MKLIVSDEYHSTILKAVRFCFEEEVVAKIEATGEVDEADLATMVVGLYTLYQKYAKLLIQTQQQAKEALENATISQTTAKRLQQMLEKVADNSLADRLLLNKTKLGES